MFLLGFPCCDKLVATDVGTTYTTPVADVLEQCGYKGHYHRMSRVAMTCNDVTETYERPNGLRYQEVHRDCVAHYELRGPCR